MELLSINKQWAVFDPCGAEKPFDRFAALRDLVSIKTYRQLVSFLRDHACNNLFVQPCEDHPQKPWGECWVEIWFDEAADSFNLQDNLESALEQELGVDLFDDLVREDLKDVPAFGIRLSELAYFQKTIKNFLTLSAIYNGAAVPGGLFKEIPSEALLDKKFGEKCLGLITKGDSALFANDSTVLMSDTRTFCIKYNDACMDHHGMFGDEWVDSYDSTFYPSKKYITQPIVADGEVHTVIAANYELHEDGVVYRSFCLDDCDKELLPGDFDLEEDEYAVAVTFAENINPDEAKRLLASRIVEGLLNRGIDELDQDRFSYNNIVPTDRNQYTFSMEDGIKKNDLCDQSTWFHELYNEAVRLTLEGKVTLCTMCHTPVLIKDFRGKKKREVCSGTCKTRLSRARRETAIAYAVKGFPVEYAIEQIGEEYADSVRKWYKEAPIIAAPEAE